VNTDFDKERFTCKRGNYCIGRAPDLADPMLHTRTQEYRRKLSGMMKPLSGEDMFRCRKLPVITQPESTTVSLRSSFLTAKRPSR